MTCSQIHTNTDMNRNQFGGIFHIGLSLCLTDKTRSNSNSTHDTTHTVLATSSPAVT